jgi:succinoglycan biosynthesis protein ExoA
MYASVLLPVRNEERYIRESLGSLLNQDLPIEQYEIIVIDGQSTDRTKSIVQELCSNKRQVVVLENSKRLVTAALNIGLSVAKGSFIIRADAHARYAPDYLSSCLNVAGETGADNVGGHMRALPGTDTLIAYAIMLSHYSAFGLGGGSFHNTEYEGPADTVWLGCFKREIFDRIGFYREELYRSEDIELNARLRQCGGKIWLSKRIHAFYYCRSKLQQVVRQRWADGYGIVRTLPLNSRAVKARHLAPLFAAFVGVILLVLTGLKWQTGSGRYSLIVFLAFALLYMGLSIYFTVISFLTECKRKKSGTTGYSWLPPPRPVAALVLPLVFLCTHISYGLGSLAASTGLAFVMAKKR